MFFFAHYEYYTAGLCKMIAFVGLRTRGRARVMTATGEKLIPLIYENVCEWLVV